MKKIKGLIASLIVTSMFFAQLTFVETVCASTNISSDDSYVLSYELVDNGDDDYLQVTGFEVYPKSEYTLTIPANAVYNEISYPVRAIADGAFAKGCTSTYTTEIVTYKNSSGYTNDLLTNVVFEGTNLISIGTTDSDATGVFNFCSNKNFTDLTIPDNITTIGKLTFNRCTKLESLTLGKGVSLLPFQAICQSNLLETITIKADDFTFDKVGSIYVTKAIKNIVIESEKLTIPGLLYLYSNSNVTIDSYADTGFNFSVKNSAVYNALIQAGYTSDYITYTLPVGTEIVIPSADNAYSLKYTVSDNGVILNGFSTSPESLVDLVIPSSITDPATGLKFNVTETAQSAFKSANIKSAVIPGSIITFGTRLFETCTDLQNVELQEGITYLNFYMFYNCTALTELIIPASVTSVDFKSMQGANNLVSVKILGENLIFSNKIVSGKSVGGTVFYVKNETVKTALEACADNTNATYFNKAVLINDETDDPNEETETKIKADIDFEISKWRFDSWILGGLDIVDTLQYARKQEHADISVDDTSLASTDINNLPTYISDATSDLVCNKSFAFDNSGKQITLDITFNSNYADNTRQLDNLLLMLSKADDTNDSGIYNLNLSYSTTESPDTFVSVYTDTKTVTQDYAYLSMKNIENITDVHTLRFSITYSGSKFSISEIDINMKNDPYSEDRQKYYNKIKPVNVIADGMVLQRNVVNTIWGTGGIEGETLTVNIDGIEKSTTVKNGKWSVDIDPMNAGGPYVMTIACNGTDTVTIKDIWFGEVWLAGGQSNMARAFKTLLDEIDGRDVYYGIDKAKLKAKIQSAVDGASDEKTRFCVASTTATSVPYYNVRLSKSWSTVNSTDVPDMSAVCYYFAKEMREEFGEDVPIGIIMTAVPGSPLQGWVSNELIASDSDYAKYDLNWTDAMYYNSMIYPLSNYNFKGVLWYQGESNVSDRVNFKKLFPQTIDLWRTLFDDPDMPFIFTQLAPYTSDEDYSRDLFREVQLNTMLSIPNTAMAVITDSGDPYNIHPMDKSEVGLRLAAAAKAVAYGNTEEYSGPLYKSMYVEEDKLILSFDHIGTGLKIGADWGEDIGLVISGEKLDGFEISNDGINFVKADAVISGNTVKVSAVNISDPVAVRYGWQTDYYMVNDEVIRDTVIPTLYNKEGFPAVPFRAYLNSIDFDVNVADENGISITDATVANELNVTINYTNKSVINAAFIIAVYDNGMLRELNTLTAKHDYSGEEFIASHKIDLASYDDRSNINVKIFAFDNIETIKPLTPFWNWR